MKQLPILPSAEDEAPKVEITFAGPGSNPEIMKQNKITEYLLMTGLLYFLKGVESEISFTIDGETYLAKADKANDTVSITKCEANPNTQPNP